jgi:hypothetical protein
MKPYVNLDILHLKSALKIASFSIDASMIAESTLANRKRRFFKDIALRTSSAKQCAKAAATT